MLPRLALLLLLAVPMLRVTAADERLRPLRVELISTCDSIRPGQSFHIGIRQTIAPGYHSYWRSPGTVGMPMQIEWNLPAGVTVGELLWPLPETSKMAAYTVWGYHDSALLAVPVKVTDAVRPGTELNITGTAIWMCCAKSCHPDKETVAITLPVRGNPKTNHVVHAAITRTLQDQPKTDPAWRLKAVTHGDRYVLTITAAGPTAALPESAYFFDYDRQISSDRGQRAKRTGNALRITMSAEEHTGEQLPRLRGMLVTEPEWRPGLRSLAVDIPIHRQP